MLRKIFLSILALAVLAVCGLWANWQLAVPSHDRNWAPVYSRQPMVDVTDGIYRVENVRNWTYGPGGETSPEWITAEIDPSQLTRVWFIEEPFGEVRAIAHTMLGFEFSDGAVHVASVEARREVGESYGGLKAGFFPMHEYLVFWTTERDMFGNSTYFTEDDLYLLPLDLPPEGAKAVLDGMMALTEELEGRPRWYNTFFSNCTNVLARTVNAERPDAVPWNIAWYLPGYAAEFLYDKGFMPSDLPFAALYDASHITPVVREVYGETDPVAFSRAIRERR